MADTGENQQIIGRANANAAEMVRASQKLVAKKRSTARASNDVFRDKAKGSRRKMRESKQQSPSTDPKASRTRLFASLSHEARRSQVNCERACPRRCSQ